MPDDGARAGWSGAGMRLLRLGIAVLAPVLGSLATEAAAATYNVNCNTGVVSNAASQSLTAGTVLGAVLGTPGALATVRPAPASGDVVEITGICAEDVAVTVSGLTIANDGGLGSGFNSGDGVKGQFEVSGATGIVIDELLLGDTAPVTLAAADVALLHAHDGASVTLSNAHVEFSPLLGVLAERSAVVALQNDQVSNNGGGALSDTLPRDNGGIEARDNGTVTLGAADGSAPVTVSNNPFDAVAAYRNSGIVIYNAALSGNAAHQITVMSASAAFITVVPNDGLPTTTITAPGGAPTAIQAIGTSTLRIDNGVAIVGATGAEAISVQGGSALLLQGSNVSAPGAGPVIEASSGSVIALAGGNKICNGSFSGATCNAGAGMAIEIDHVASLVQVNPADFGYTAAPELVTGTGTAILQSTIDLGRGIVASSPSLTWTMGSGAISVAQNSSFRLDGGVTISGQLKISQSSNGFFNLSQGGGNAVTAILCPFTSIPASHVAAGTAGAPFVLPFPNPSTNFLATNKSTSQCLSF